MGVGKSTTIILKAMTRLLHFVVREIQIEGKNGARNPQRLSTVSNQNRHRYLQGNSHLV